VLAILAWGSCCALPERGRCCYLRRDWLAAIIDPTYDHLDFSLANLPVDFEPHDVSSLEKQRADFIAMWSSDSRSTGPLH
jgi:hypothetical protein